MASFEEILKMPASEIKEPQALPVGSYHCIVDGLPTAGKSSIKGTDYFQFKLRILSAMADVDAEVAREAGVVGKIVTADYYVTETAVYRLRNMLRDDLGISDANGKSLEEMLSEANGKQIIVKLRHELSQDGKRVFHRVDSTAAV